MDQYGDDFDGEYSDDDDDQLPPKTRWLRRVLWWMLWGLVIAAAAIGWAYHMSQQEPEFYQAALQQRPEVAREKGAELETTVINLYSAMLEQGRWQGTISEDQINGWLATELNEKFPELLPAEVIADPRVSIRASEISVAGRANYRGIKGVIVANLDIFKTDQQDQIAIRFRSIRAGVVPVPIRSFTDKISRGLERNGFPNRWTELEGDPVLTIIVPDEHLLIEEVYRVTIETLEMHERQIFVSGTTINLVE